MPRPPDIAGLGLQTLRSAPRRASASPSWAGQRQFEVIGTGRLPLQSHNLDTEFQATSLF